MRRFTKLALATLTAGILFQNCVSLTVSSLLETAAAQAGKLPLVS